MICTSMFSINYNNKQFMVLLDENNRNSFLEINSQGKLDYPFLEDYLALYKIFNIHNPYIYYHVPTFNFNPSVKAVKKGILSLMAVITVINSIPNAYAIDANAIVNESNVILYETSTSEKKQTIVIEDTNDLDKYLGKVTVTKDLILDAIANNEKIPEDIKKIYTEEFEQIYSDHPNANYRVLYENSTTLNVNIFSAKEYNKRFPSGSDANYDSFTNSINIKENAPKDTIAHELAHSYHSFYRVLENVIIVRKPGPTALNEGMTDIMTEYIAVPEYSSNAYKISKEVLKYLMYLTGFTYEEYSRFGLTLLLQKATDKYPDINFNYISSTLNSLMRSEIYRGIKIITGPINMYDELFKSCLKASTKTNGYEPFNHFLYTLIGNDDSSLINSYFEKYNKHLKELGYDAKNIKIAEDRLKIYSKANCIIYSEIKEVPVSFGYEAEDNTLYKINEDGTFTLLNADGKLTYYCFRPKNFELFKMKASTRSNNLEEGLTAVLKEDTRLKNYKYQPIPIYVDSKEIANKLTGTLNVQVGFTKTKEAGFILTDYDGKVIYQTTKDLSDLSNKLSLNSYISIYSYNTKDLELTDIFNITYLKRYQLIHMGFNNFNVIGDQIVKESFTLVTVVDQAEGTAIHTNYKLSDCKLYVSDYDIFTSDRDLEAKNYDYVIDLESILSFANLLDSDISYYEIEMRDLEELTKSYIASLNSSVQRSF